MKFEPGDRVSFINEKQDGIVKRILPGNIVLVEIEDGFEIPAKENELVKIGSSKMKEPDPVHEAEPVIQRKASDLLQVAVKNELTIAAIPDAEGAILTGSMTYFLVNRSGFDVVFTLYESGQINWNGIACGVCFNEDYFEIKKYNRADLTEIKSFLFQGLLFSENKLPQLSQIKKEFGVLLPKLQNARTDMQGSIAFAATFTLFSNIPDEEIPIKDLVDKFNPPGTGGATNKARPVNKEPSPEKFGIHINEKEVDLHIEELVPDVSGLSNAEMLKIQIDKFHKEMDHAIRNHFQRIIFIHGIGNGKLKSELKRELGYYKGIRQRDGDPRKYGHGATEVIFD